MIPTVSEIDPRFGGILRLYGAPALRAISCAHVTVIGLGGVGSWAAEALARSGIGKLTLIDLDELCITNVNRQVHALTSTVGQSKVATLKKRLNDIHPECLVHAHEDFLTKKNIESLIPKDCGFLIDAIDSAAVKAELISWILRAGSTASNNSKRRLVTTGSSGGKRDAQNITVTDLGLSQHDPLLAKVRGILYRHHGFTRPNPSRRGSTRKFRVDAISSPEPRVFPAPDGGVSYKKTKLDGAKLDCSQGLGSSMMVTASFGMLAAQQTLNRIIAAGSKQDL